MFDEIEKLAKNRATNKKKVSWSFHETKFKIGENFAYAKAR